MDKLLSGIKDLSAIKRYLAAINQTTDDFLVAYDIKDDIVHFFAPIHESFRIGAFAEQDIPFEDLLSAIHPADRKALCADIAQICNGKKDTHDMNFRMFRKNGDTAWVNSRGKVLHDENGAPFLMIGRLSEEAVRHLFNPLTGLWNKTKLREDLKGHLAVGGGWLMLLEIPSLVDINLSYGREFGNDILREMADLLEELDGVLESYHADGNKFAVILRPCDAKEAKALYGSIALAMNEKCDVLAGTVPIDGSVFMDVSQILDAANLTLRNAESAGDPIAFFSAEDISKKISELTLLEELKESVRCNFEGFEVYYQPQIKSGTYALYGVEALLRYNSPERGRVFPDEFIPLLEQSGLIDPVGMWVLSQALAQCKAWRQTLPALQVAVNFSSVQFEDRHLGEKIVSALKAADLPGDALTVELTESVQLGENKHFYDHIKYIRSYGVRFSIDDFGTGYSNLGYLKQLDVNEIKIDRNFVFEIEQNTYNYRLVSNLIEFAKNNLIHTCCEGVETTKELSVLEPLKADVFQGYLFDKPCTAEEIEEKYVDPSSHKYAARMAALEEIHRFNEEHGSIHFNPVNILRENDIGLWIMRLDESDHCLLHVDGVMERVLGIAQRLTPEECYVYWHSRISPADVAYVDGAIALMRDGGKAVQLEYRWMHPVIGEVSVRSSGIRTQGEGKTVSLEGYHRILTGVQGVEHRSTDE